MKITPSRRLLRPFSETEAWTLFKWAAYGEAAGWTLLITGIIVAKTHLPGHAIALPLLGQTHGMLFAFYLAIVLATASSMRWDIRRLVVAIAVSVPPYGTLVFEQWALRDRSRRIRQNYQRSEVRILVCSGARVLLVQPSDHVWWGFPGGAVRVDETAKRAATRILAPIGGKREASVQLLFEREVVRQNHPWRLYYFSVQFGLGDAPHIRAIRTSLERCDEARYVDAVTTGDLDPELASDVARLRLPVSA
jgi:integral membrane protein